MNKTELTKELECPVCFQIPRNPPIYQCINGHLICSICQEKIKDICPQVKKNLLRTDTEEVIKL